MTSLPFEDLPEPSTLESFDDFDSFWAAYPRKVGKLVALTAYCKAVKRASHNEIMAGVRLYLTTKPAYADWCHPATWLNQGRWMDEPDTPAKPDPEQVWRDRASMAKTPWARHQVCRQDKEELHRMGLLTDDELAEALR